MSINEVKLETEGGLREDLTDALKHFGISIFRLTNHRDGDKRYYPPCLDLYVRDQVVKLDIRIIRGGWRGRETLKKLMREDQLFWHKNHGYWLRNSFILIYRVPNKKYYLCKSKLVVEYDAMNREFDTLADVVRFIKDIV